MAQQEEFQTPGQPIDVTDWSPDEDHPVFPVGSKPKRLLVCPRDAPDACLIPGHDYIFKTAEGWKEQQLWSEIIAYRISTLVGLEVPPALSPSIGVRVKRAS